MERCKEEYIGEEGYLVKEQINIYRQHIGTPQYQQLAAEESERFICFLFSIFFKKRNH